ncbi:MAG: FG-GAP-like repeat-containing protein [Elusimicrobiota bacterium]|nr:FG-GAP-like repeat-containing protein [Elusimicrobiota bacterium]
MDGTPPVSALEINGGMIAAGATVYAATTDVITLVAMDTVSNGVMSGLTTTYFLVDITSDECSYMDWSGGINGMGSCENRFYGGPFSLPAGEHVIYYFSQDNAGNIEPLKTVYLVVAAIDTAPPTVTASINNQILSDNAAVIMMSTDTITLTAIDEGSGLLGIYYTVDAALSTGTATTYTAPFTLSAGTHTVYYSAMDNAGNVAAVKSVFATVAAKKYENPAQWPYFEFLRKFGSWNGAFLGGTSINFDKDANMLTFSGAAVQKYTADGEYLGAFGAGQLYSPKSMAACPSGDTWIVDYDYTRGLFKLKKFGFNGALLNDMDLSNQSALAYTIPVFVTCDKSNLLYILGFEGAWTGVIFKLNASGIFLNRLPVSFPSGNTGLIADAQGNLYTRNSNLSKAYKYSPEGQLLFEWATNPGASGNLAADDFGNIYLNNSQKHMLEVYASTGGTIASFGSLPAGYTQEPLTPTGVHAVHPVTGRVFVADSGKIKVYGLDHTPPSAPVILSPINIGTVYTQSPLILGRAESGAVLQIYENLNLTGAINTDEGGLINAKSPLLTYGSHLLNFKASDLAGNLSAFSPAIHFSVNSANQVAFSTSIPGPVYPQVPWTIQDTSVTVVGDFDRDGKADVVGFSRGGWYSFYAGNNDGTFRNVYNTIIPLTNGAYADGDDAVAADFNKDGKLDVAASIHNPVYPLDDELLVLLYGNGDGTFQMPVTIDHLIPYAGISKGDFNKDGYTDIASVSGNAIKVYLGDPASLFISISTPIPAELPAGRGGGIVMADIDGDGKTDILFRNAVLFGNGSAGFDSRVILSYDYDYDSFVNVGKALVSDLNQDGHKDIILVGPAVVSVFVNMGNRIFEKVQQIPSGGTLFYSGGVADFNGDGVVDIAVSPYNLQNVFVMAGYGDGTFAAPMALPTYGYARYGNTCGTMALEDLNGDGKTDILQSSSRLGLTGSDDIHTFFSFLNKTSVPDTIPPSAVSIYVENTADGVVAVSWVAPGDDGNTSVAKSYELRYKNEPILNDTAFNSAQRVLNLTTPRQPGDTERFIIYDLSGGTTYYFALKTYDDAGNASALSNSPMIFTRYIVKTTNTIAGNPEISMVSAVQPYITQVSTVSGLGAVAIGSAAVQSLAMASNMYEIGPEGVYEPPAILTFYYSTAALAGVGLIEADAAVYEYFTGTGWVKLNGQVLDTLNHKITVPITRIASLFGIFGVVTDKAAPVSELFVAGSSWTIPGAGLFINTRSSVSLNAFDPIVYGTSSGVAFTEFRIDAGTATPFTLYASPFMLSTGAHKVEFRSRDKAGNIEAVKTAKVTVDGSAPSAWYTISGSSFAAGGVIYAASGSTITLISSDTAAGVKALFYTVNGSTRSALSGMAEISLSSAGAYNIGYHAEDNVNNIGAENVVSIYVDTIAPVSTLSLSGDQGRGGWYVSAVDAAISARDDNSGIWDTFYSLDGSSFTSYVSSFSVLSEGKHDIKAYSSDNVANIESVQLLAFGVDISTPVVGYSYLPAANGDGWNNTAVDVVFTATDAVSGIEYCSSSFTIINEGIGIPISGYCADYAGWTSTASFSVNIDTTAPLSNAEIAAEYGLNGWLLSPAGITLISTDNLSGLGGLYYSVDGSSFALYSSSFAVSGEGAHILKYYSVDTAGNKGTERELAFKLDINAPIVEAVFNPAANNYGWNNMAVTAVFSGTDTASGLAYCESEKVVDIEGSSQTVTGYCADYAGWTSTAALVVNIDTTAPNLSYAADPAPNEAGWNNSDVAVKFACADGLSGVKSCPADIRFADEGLNISTVATAYDYAGNLENISATGINIDRTAPVSTAAISGAYKNSWYSSTVTVVLASTDTLSGVGRIMYRLEGAGGSGVERAYVEPVIVGANGLFKLYYYAEDIAGNKEAEKTIEFKIDASAPSVEYTLVPAPSGGWNNTAVQVVFSGTDTLTGIDVCSSETVAVEGAMQKIVGWCRDLAGNMGYSTASVNLDLTKPVVSANSTPGPNESGWNNGPIEVAFVGTDTLSGLAYCEPEKTISIEGSSQAANGYCLDNAGNSSTSTIIVNIDIASPGISAARLPLANAYGWANQDVKVSYTCTDGLSGVATCPDERLFSSEGADISTTAAAFDYAGNIRSVDVSGISIDKTLPVTRAELSGVAENAWYNTAVTLTLISTDALSGVDKVLYRVEGSGYSGAEQAYAEPVVFDGAGVFEVHYQTIDRAGNAETEKSLTFKIDRGLPQISYTLAPPSNEKGWNNTDVTVSFECSDGLSGIAGCPGFITYSMEGIDISTSVRAWDLAGNYQDSTVGGIKIDKTPPVSSAAFSGVYNNGYYGGAVAVTITSTDALSGVAGTFYSLDGGELAEYQGPVWVSVEGSHLVRYYAQDKAGNIEAGRTVTFNIDVTAPIVFYAIIPPANFNGWNNSAAEVVFTATDTFSGVASCTPGQIVSIEGSPQLVAGSCADLAGNVAYSTAIVNIDLSVPEVSAVKTPVANADGWNNTDVAVSFECSDGLAGVASCPGVVTYSEAGVNISTSVRAWDLAGNYQTIAVSGINIDKTPAISTAALSGHYRNGWYSSAVGIVLGSTDALSGVEQTYYSLDGAAYAGYSQPLSVSGEGAHELRYYAVDKAGNMETSGKVEFKIDTQVPVVDYAFTPMMNAAGWNNSVVSVVFSGTDAVSGVEECSSGNISAEGAGQKITGWCRDIAGNIAYATVTVNVDITAPIVSASQTPARNADGWNNTPVLVAFTGTDSVSGMSYCTPAALITSEGSSRAITGYCADYAGWTSTAALVVNIDTTAPNLSYMATPAPNEAGWNNSEVAVKFACADSLSGVKFCPADIRFADEGTDISTAAAGDDNAGNSENISVAGINLDRTAPVSTAAVSGVYKNGWYSSTATVILVSTDALSGVKRILYRLEWAGENGEERLYSEPLTISVDGITRLYYYSEDRAGNREAEKTIEFKIDASAPLVDYALIPAPDSGGWNNTAVQVVFTGTDTLSGIDKCSSETVAVEGVTQKAAGWCRDVAGNIGYSTAIVNLDLTKPAVSASQLPSPNESGWNNGPVEVAFTGSDTLSGLAYCEPARIISVEGSSQTVSGYCLDYSGLSSTVTYIISIDTTAPLLGYFKTPANADGWNNTDVAIGFECSDGLSGIAGCPGSITYSAEGIDISTSVRAWDLAGNYQGSAVSGINIDKTPPVSASALAGTFRNGWYSSAVSVTLTSTDTLSGVKETYYSMNAGQYALYTQALVVSADGSHEVRYYSIDKAGNIETVAKVGFKIDTGAPGVGYALTPSANAAGWNNSAVSVVFSGTDAGSGIEKCSSGNTSAEGRDQQIVGWCRDLAGNISYATATVSVDLTAPGITHTRTAANADGWNNGDVAVNFTCTDSLSGIGSCPASITYSAEGLNISTTTRAIDLAGNFADEAVQGINIDKTNPISASALAGTLQNDWYSSAVTVTLSATDVLSGVKETYYSLDSGQYTLYMQALVVSADGAHEVKYYSVDKAGNAETAAKVDFKIDTGAPAVGYTLNPPANAAGWNNSVVSVAFSGTDAGSGVEECTSGNVTGDGAGQKLAGWCRDLAGNVTYATATVSVDLTLPAVSASQTPAQNANGWNNGSVEVSFAGTDAMSNIAYCEPAKTISTEGASQTVSGYCVDYAGLSSTVSYTASIDVTVPVITHTRTPANADGWNNSDVEVTFTCTDGLSGIGNCPAGITYSAEGLNISTITRAIDLADNFADAAVQRINIDKTAPISTSLLAGTYRNGWYSSIVSVTLTSTDSLSSVKETYYSLDSGQYTLYTQPLVVSAAGAHEVRYYSIDKAGNIETVAKIDFKIDTGTPTVVYTLNPPANALGWNSTTISVIFAGTDSGSGVEECSSGNTSSEGAGQKIAGWCRDLAGNVTYATATVSVDLTTPAVSASQVPAQNAYGWNSGAVEVSFAGTDVLSGIAYCEPAKTISTEGSSQTVSGYCVDYAGLSSTVSYTASIDITVPVITHTRTPANADGWNNSDVAVNFTCTDSLSGIRSCPDSITYSAEGLNISTTTRATDLAGNFTDAAIQGINIDKTAPVSASALAGIYRNGWYSSIVSVTLTSTDSLSGVKETYYSLDGGQYVLYEYVPVVSADGAHEVLYYSTDKAGNIETAGKVDFKIDTGVPTVSYTLNPPANAAGWNSGAVSVVFAGTDAVSGIEECSSGNTSAEGAEQQIAGWCRDSAGNVGYATATVSVDLTTPVVSASQAPAQDAYGWNNGAVSVVFTGTDTVSGIAYCTPGRFINVEGSSQAVTGYCADYAGLSSTAMYTISIDTTAPLLTSSRTQSNADGWNNGDVLLNFTCTDSLSGVGSCPAGITCSAEGLNISTTVRATDLAGNFAEAAVQGINIDKTAPISASALAGTLRNGWYSSAVSLTLTSTDTLSGVAKTFYSLDGGAFAEYQTPISVNTEDLHTVRYYARDKAGNTEAEQTLEFNIDVTVPVVSYTVNPPANSKGWNNSSTEIVFSATDTFSGVDFCAPGQIVAVEGGSQKVVGSCTDRAGNIAYSTATINTDFTKPVTLASQVPVPNSNGWNKEPVTVSFAGIDALSGTAYCTPEKLISAEAAEQGVTGYCTDYAGNSSTATLTLNIDRSVPTITISSPVAGQTFIATRGVIPVLFAVKDNLDPAPAFEAFLTQVEDKGSPRGNRPSIIAVINGQSIEPLDIDDGIWQLAISATDFADNINSLSGGVFEVVHDVLAPRTVQAVAGGEWLAADETTYIKNDTALELVSRDNLILAEDGIGLGVKNQTVRLKSDGLIVKELTFANPEPKQGASFTSTFTVSTLGLADGLYSLAYRAEDVLGNIEAEKALTIGLDNTAPETAAELAGTPGENGWHVSAVTINLAANDALSGVAGISYQVESNGQKSEIKNYIEPVVVSAEGLYKVYFSAKDKLGNTEAEKTVAFKIDLTNPLISVERSPLANEYGWNNTAVTAGYICTDGLSGVKSCPPAATLAGEGLSQSVSGEALDYAGNRAGASVSGVNIDKTAPISTYRPEGMVYISEIGKTYINLAANIYLSATDPISGGAASGINAVEYYIDSAPFMVYTSSFSLTEGIRTVYYRSRDKAGNIETAKSAEVNVDGTSPVTAFNISALLYIADGMRYITPASILSFAAADPLTNDTASGVMLTKYRIDGGNWQVYVDSFSIAAEGLHTVEYYSLDRVQNTETMKTAKLAVDNTPPATAISFGEPKAETFGLPIITPATKITLSAVDTVINEAASGLNSIFYEIKNVPTGALTPVTAYLSPFSIPESGTFIIRFWSKDNAGNIEAVKEKMAAVTTWREDGLAAVSGLEMSGTADIAGAVRSNAVISLGGNARILGDVTASTITLSGKAQITGRQVSGAAPVNPAPINLAGIIQSAVAVNNNILVSSSLVNGKLVLGSKASIVLSTGTYYFKGMELSGGSSIMIAGKVDILVEGGISINGGSSLNASGAASLLSIIISTSSELKFNGGAALAACIYAPYSAMKLSGNALLGGHYFVKTAAVSGTGNILQSGEVLPVASAPTGGGIKTKAAAMSAGGFGVLPGPDPAFRLGEVYVYPNPAKGSEVPVFHIETGIADSVKITIYTVSGRAAHEYTLTGLPAELDDGNGLSYAYEYTWRGHIPSGVYLYYIEAQKAGQKLKKTGKFAVVR